MAMYQQVSLATGSRTVHHAGQVSLGAVGATFDDVVRLTVHLVDLNPEKVATFTDGLDRAAATLGISPAAPRTAIGVAALADPGYLPEAVAVAVLDGQAPTAAGSARPIRLAFDVLRACAQAPPSQGSTTAADPGPLR